MSNYDIFISYPWDENETKEIVWRDGNTGAQPEYVGWVDYFQLKFRQLLRLHTEVGPSPHIFLDKTSIRRSDPLTETIKAALEESQLLICIICPQYFNTERRDWCEKERFHFLNYHGDGANILAINIRNISGKLPPEFNDCLGFNFNIPATKDILDRPLNPNIHTPETIKLPTRPLNPSIDNECEMFNEELARLFFEITIILNEVKEKRELKEHERIEYKGNWPKVYLAPVPNNMLDQWNNIKNELIDNDIAVYPLKALTEMDAKDEVSESLETIPSDCRIIGHIVSPIGCVKTNQFEDGLDNFVFRKLEKSQCKASIVCWQSHGEIKGVNAKFDGPSFPYKKREFIDAIIGKSRIQVAIRHKGPVWDVIVDDFCVDKDTAILVRTAIDNFAYDGMTFGRLADVIQDRRNFVRYLESCAAMITIYGPDKDVMDKRTKTIKDKLEKSELYNKLDFGLYLTEGREMNELQFTINSWSRNQCRTPKDLKCFLTRVAAGMQGEARVAR